MNTRLKRIVTVLALAGVIGGGYHLVASETHDVLVEPARAATRTTTSTPAALPDFSSIVARYGNAVVNVSVVGKATAAGDSVDVTLAAVPTDRVALGKAESAAGGKPGLDVRPLSPAERAQVGLTGGLVVVDVDGAAARAGIQQGDVIVAVNGTPVKSIDQLRDIVAEAGKHVAPLVQRDEARIFIPVPLG